MGGQWGTFLVALIVIIVYYFAVKTYRKQNRAKAQHKKLKNTSKFSQKPIIKPSSHSKSMKTASSSSSRHRGSLVMHPHSLEVAKIEFTQVAPKFRGAYESLYLSSQGRGANPEHVLKIWDETIKNSKAKYLVLTWTTLIRKHYGNLYSKDSSPWGEDSKKDDLILKEWLKQLCHWGLKRELLGESHTPLWTLNGETVEDGKEHKRVQY